MATPVTLKLFVYANSHSEVLDAAEEAVFNYFEGGEEIDSELLKNIKYEILVSGSDEHETAYKAEVIARFKDE